MSATDDSRIVVMNKENIIHEIWKDSDGWWAILKQGWTVDGCAGLREDSKRKLMQRIKTEARQSPEV